MKIDLLPLAAFALEQPHETERPQGGPHTLTLRPTGPALQRPHENPMSGSAEVEPMPLPCDGPLRAAVLPAGGPPLTITF